MQTNLFSLKNTLTRILCFDIMLNAEPKTHLFYTWPVGETVNTHAFHACIYGFEPRTGHQKIPLLQPYFYPFYGCNIYFRKGTSRPFLFVVFLFIFSFHIGFISQYRSGNAYI